MWALENKFFKTVNLKIHFTRLEITSKMKKKGWQFSEILGMIPVHGRLLTV